MWESSLKQDGNVDAYFGNFINVSIFCGFPAGYILLNVFHGVLLPRLKSSQFPLTFMVAYVPAKLGFS